MTIFLHFALHNFSLKHMTLYSLENSTVLFSPDDWLNAAGALLILSYFSLITYKAVNDFGGFDWLALLLLPYCSVTLKGSERFWEF